MTWIVYALLAAVFAAFKDIASKKNLENLDEYVVAWAFRVFSLLFLLPLLFFIEIPSLGNQFWMALLLSGSLNILTTIFYMKALKASNVSITAPMVTFTPLFLLITSPIILGEFPTMFGLFGVLLIVFGAYLLNIKEKNKKGLLAPFKALLNEKGPRYMLLVAFVWSISSNFDKIGIKDSSPIFWAVALHVFLVLAIFPIVFYKSRHNIKQITLHYKTLIPIGLFSSLAAMFGMFAIELTLVTYMISVKRLSIIISVLLGHFIFKEKDLKERLLSAAIMVIGVLFITLS